MLASQLLVLLIVFLVLLGFNELFRRSRIAIVVVLFVLPLILTPFWIGGTPHYIFTWAKLYSIIAYAGLYFLFHLAWFRQMAWAKILFPIVLAANIIEAVLQDASLMFAPSIINACSGLLLILTIPRWKDIAVDTASAMHDVIWPQMSWLWIGSYVVWNWTFVYLGFPEHAAYHFIVLLACVIPALFKRTLWLQARVYTLAVWMICFFSFYNIIMQNAMTLPRPYEFLLFASLVSLSFNVVNFVVTHRKRILT